MILEKRCSRKGMTEAVFQEDTMSKILITYFSAGGTTAKVAKDLARQTGADEEQQESVKRRNDES